MERRSFLRALAGSSVLGVTATSADALQPSSQAAPVRRRATGTRQPRARTICGMPAVADLSTMEADVAFLGVPYDLGHGSKPGTRLGPAAIREASSEVAGPLGASDAGFYDRETGVAILKGVRVVDAGDVVIPTASVEQSLDNVTAAASAIVGHKAMPVVFGGDHSITFGVLRGFKDAGRKIHILHFDAHQDFGAIADPTDGRPIFTHGNHLRHAIELPWVSGITMLGLRGLARGGGATAADARQRGIDLISSSQIFQLGAAATAAKIPAAEGYYVTIDIDVLDPAIAPATGTPVPGGLGYYQLADVLDAIAARGRLVGFDIMEVSPPYDVNDTTSALAVYLAVRFLGSVFKHQQPARRA
jgi:agmatinase